MGITWSISPMFATTHNIEHYLYYKRVDPYIWTELAPVLEGCRSRR